MLIVTSVQQVQGMSQPSIRGEFPPLYLEEA